MNLEVLATNDTRLIREAMGLSDSEFADALSLGSNGDRIVRRWEQDTDYAPTPMAWAAIRFLFLAVQMYQNLPSGNSKARMAEMLPAAVQ